MKPVQAAFVIGTFIALTAGDAAADGPGLSGAPGPANRIVGLWSTEALVSPCKPPPTAPTTPPTPIRNTLLFHAGGTVVESPRFPPGGAPNVAGVPGIYQRGQALGTWSYDPRRRTYFLHLQFDNYVDNVYHGYSTVDREIALTKDGWLGSGPVRSARFKTDGTLIVEVCGEALSARL
jgi:hypothetical protein